MNTTHRWFCAHQKQINAPELPEVYIGNTFYYAITFIVSFDSDDPFVVTYIPIYNLFEYTHTYNALFK